MSGLSDTFISNLALSNVGQGTIESLEEQSAEAKTCKTWYNHSRAQALSAYDWSFARKRQTLASHSEDPPSGVWTYRYQYPADCLTARYLVNPAGPTADPVPYQVETDSNGETKTILTDLDDAVLVYTFDQKAEAIFSHFFVELLAYLLGHHIAFSLTGKSSIRKDMLAMYLRLLLKAPAEDANEAAQRQPREAESIRARS